MIKLVHLFKRYPFSTACVVLIWILCFCTPPHTPLDNVPLMDKWTHMAMYGGTCSVIWIESFRAGTAVGHLRRMLLWAWLVPMLMSGLIEILQANCTGEGEAATGWTSLQTALGRRWGWCSDLSFIKG